MPTGNFSKTKAKSEMVIIFFENAYFPPKFFLQFWDYSADSHGQGIKVFYPMKIKHFIYWSPKRYRVEDHNPSSRPFQEKLSSPLLK